MEDATTGKRTALVTGASRGIGLELARLLAADGHDLAIAARDRQTLERLAGELRAAHGVAVRWYATDLSRPRAATDLWADLEADGVRTDVLVNNAGFGLYGPLAQQDPDSLAGMLELNVAALTTLTRLALPGMLARRHGRILNLASLAAYQPGGPWMAAYYASKAYVLSFSRALAMELKHTGVSVTALCPGPTRTAFEQRSGAGSTPLYQGAKMEAAAVALAGYRAMKRGAAVAIPGGVAKILAFAGELPPRRIALEVNRLLLKSRAPAAAARGSR